MVRDSCDDLAMVSWRVQCRTVLVWLLHFQRVRQKHRTVLPIQWIMTHGEACARARVCCGVVQLRCNGAAGREMKSHQPNFMMMSSCDEVLVRRCRGSRELSKESSATLQLEPTVPVSCHTRAVAARGDTGATSRPLPTPFRVRSFGYTRTRAFTLSPPVKRCNQPGR